MPEEVRFFGRHVRPSLVVGVAYWFLSYEAAGTIMLLGFGLATGAGVHAAARQRPRPRPPEPPRRWDGVHGKSPTALFGDESGPVPTRSAAPLAVGLGVAVIGGWPGAFGPWFVAAGACPLLLGAVDWLRAANRELDQLSGRWRARGER